MGLEGGLQDPGCITTDGSHWPLRLEAEISVTWQTWQCDVQTGLCVMAFGINVTNDILPLSKKK